jgi:hypothetical protein
VNDLQGSGEDDNNNHVLYFLMSVAGSQFDDIWEEELAKMQRKKPNEIEDEGSQSSAQQEE